MFFIGKNEIIQYKQYVDFLIINLLFCAKNTRFKGYRAVFSTYFAVYAVSTLPIYTLKFYKIFTLVGRYIFVNYI